MTSCSDLLTALSSALVAAVPFLSWAQNGLFRANTRTPAAMTTGQKLRNAFRMVSSRVYVANLSGIREIVYASTEFLRIRRRGMKSEFVVRDQILDKLGKEGKDFFLILRQTAKFA